MSFIALVFAIILFSAMGLSTVSTISRGTVSSVEELQATQAFYISEGGMQYTLMHELNGDEDLSDNVSPTGAPFGGTPITLGEGQFWIEYVNPTEEMTEVQITSRVGDVVRTVRQTVTAGAGGQSASQYVTMGGGNLSFNSSSGTVTGDIVLSGNYTNAPNPANITMNGNITQDPDLEIPQIDFQTYRDMITTIHTGNRIFTSNYTGNLYVTGNVAIAAGVTYTGILYVAGNVTISGSDVTINGTLIAEGNINSPNRQRLTFNAQEVAGQHMPAILTQGNLYFDNADDMTINGVVWTDGNLTFHVTDRLTYNGSFMTGGNTTFNGAHYLNINFDSDLVTGLPGLIGSGNSEVPSIGISGWHAY